ncbi:hypothetical protein PbB2_02853 [Candidatus Phycosocius bacilliformis]|uniref:DUF7007 domain-containing protein n=1 Tax=Candidatus Phycosocius bacilliformis TaxID=1445552 RepID=A0A2P2EDP2_9PROT|nr:hypothetical protein [Candidatus Phycosocius bacilliformis]GBF59161.1 hypothetical protein PbB2_02853 [Candidatus Phycosocius bacilliformis]
MNRFLPVPKPMGSPWGHIQDADQIAPGIWSVSTASHGGFYLSQERMSALPDYLKVNTYGQTCWFEEDVEVSLVLLGFADEFATHPFYGKWSDMIVKTVEQYYPDAFRAHVAQNALKQGAETGYDLELRASDATPIASSIDRSLENLPTREMLRDAGLKLLKSGPEWMPRNIRTFRYYDVTFAKGRNAFGHVTDGITTTGTVVHVDALMTIIKVKPSQYAIVASGLLPNALSVGTKATITPYKRKSLEDFGQVDGPRTSSDGTSVYMIGAKTQIPGPPETPYHQDMKHQLETCMMADNYRTIANALADWRATEFIWSHEGIDHTLRFTLGNGTKVRLTYSEIPDLYTIANETTGDETKNLYTEDLAHVFQALANENTDWFRPQVVIHNANAKKAAA